MTFEGRRELLSQSEEVTPIAGAPTARIPASSVKVRSRKKDSTIRQNRNIFYIKIIATMNYVTFAIKEILFYVYF
jgi:hypothetical protein